MSRSLFDSYSLRCRDEASYSGLVALSGSTFFVSERAINQYLHLECKKGSVLHRFLRRGPEVMPSLVLPRNRDPKQGRWHVTGPSAAASPSEFWIQLMTVAATAAAKCRCSRQLSGLETQSKAQTRACSQCLWFTLSQMTPADPSKAHCSHMIQHTLIAMQIHTL